MFTIKEKNIKSVYIVSSLALILFMAISISYIFISSKYDNFQESIASLEQQSINDKKNLTKTRILHILKNIDKKRENLKNQIEKNLKAKVEHATEIASKIAENTKDKLTKEEIHSLIEKTLNIKINKGVYFFAFDLDGNNVFHGFQKNIHKKDKSNLGLENDKNFKKVLEQFIKIIYAKNEGFLYYDWKKPDNENKKFKKISYIKKIPNLDWFIGTGFYLDEFENQLKKEILDELRALRYDKDGYVFVAKILNPNGGDKFAQQLIFPIDVSKEGRYLSYDWQDIKGNYFMRDIMEGIKRNNEVFAKYWFEKPSDKKHDFKISYVKVHRDFNWMIGTGVYLNDIKKMVKEEKNRLTESITKDIKIISIMILIIILSAVIIIYFISNQIYSIFTNYKDEIFKNAKEIESTKENLEIIFNSIPIVIAYKNNNNRVLKVNRAIKNVFGLDVGDVEGKELEEISKKNAYKAYKDDLEVIRTKKPKQNYIEKYYFNNREYTAIVSKYPYIKNNIVEGVIVFMEDITEKIKIENEKKEKTKLLIQQSKMATMGEMIGAIAHQWKQPLNILSLLVDDLIDSYEYNELDDKYIETFSNKSNKQILFMSKTIEDFKNFFKPNKERNSFNLSDSISEVLSIIAVNFKKYNISIEIQNIDFELSLFENELKQVLINIVNNSKDAILENHIRDGKIYIEALEKDKNLIIAISDNGGGMSEKVLKNLFKPYFTTKSKGTGIGLYMCKMILNESLNGDIKAERFKDGSRFEITLKDIF